MKLQLSATIDKVATRADNTIALTVSTQELLPEQATILFSLKGRYGWLLFSENEFVESDVPKEPAEEFKTDVSPSKRLRSLLFLYWKNNTNKAKPFDNFYREWIEKKINEIKETLN